MRRVILMAASAVVVLGSAGVAEANGYTEVCTTRFEQVPASPATAVWYVEVEECVSRADPVSAPGAALPGKVSRPAAKPAAKPPKIGSSIRGTLVPGKVRKPLGSATSSTVRHIGVLPRTTHISGRASTLAPSIGSSSVIPPVSGQLLPSPSATPTPPTLGSGITPVPGDGPVARTPMSIAPPHLVKTTSSSKLWTGAGLGAVLVAAGVGAAVMSRKNRNAGLPGR